MNGIRDEELQIILNELNGRKFGSGLEIGAGDGCQSEKLSEKCKEFISTEYDVERMEKRNVKQVIADAQNLPFPNHSFSFVYSSNVLEHIPDLDKCLSELRRVGTEKVLHVHSLPSRWCKISQIVFYYIDAVVFIVSRKRRAKSSGISIISDKTKKRSGLQLLFPPVHGAGRSHLHEFFTWGKRRWVKRFEGKGFKIKKVIKMPYYFGKGYDIKWLRKVLNFIGLNSSYAYFLEVEE